jgi:hypothetical protein
MSYEGEVEYLCPTGHYFSHDVYSPKSSDVCPICKQPATVYHDVDHTNGMIEGDSSTVYAPKTEVGQVDVWHQDHYENHYATKEPIYMPDMSVWKLNDHPG